MCAAPIFAEISRRDKIVELFRSVIAGHGIALTMNRMDFHLREKAIIELTSRPAGLSATVLDFMFRKSPCQARSIIIQVSTDFGGSSPRESFASIQCATGLVRAASLKLSPRHIR